MNRFLLNLLPAAAAILVAAAALFSCEKGLSPEEQQAQQEQEKTEKADQFWDVVGQLVAGSDITPDYKGKTFEPVIGVADASDPQARIVPTNSAAAAARSFANLVGVDSIDENTPGYTWSNPEVGTLTYTKMSGTAWAEVGRGKGRYPFRPAPFQTHLPQCGARGHQRLLCRQRLLSFWRCNRSYG